MNVDMSQDVFWTFRYSFMNGELSKEIRPGRCGSARRGADVAQEVLQGQGQEVASKLTETRLDRSNQNWLSIDFWNFIFWKFNLKRELAVSGEKVVSTPYVTKPKANLLSST